MNEKLNPNRVNTVFTDCLFDKNEDHTKYVKAQGIMATVVFHPGRLEQHKAEIAEMLGELPAEFHEGSGGGMSFLNACMDRNGDQWTGEHRTMDQLFTLGMAINRVVCCLPRELWSALPGGLPYYTVKPLF